MVKDIETLAETCRATGRNLTIDVLEAEVVEVTAGQNGTLWVNIDGVCVVRVKRYKALVCDTTGAPSTDKVLR